MNVLILLLLIKKFRRLVVSKGGVIFNVAFTCLFWEIIGTIIRIVLTVDPAYEIGVYTFIASFALASLQQTTPVISCLIFTFYWMELMNSDKISAFPWFHKYRAWFISLFVILFVIRFMCVSIIMIPPLYNALSLSLFGTIGEVVNIGIALFYFSIGIRFTQKIKEIQGKLNKKLLAKIWVVSGLLIVNTVVNSVAFGAFKSKPYFWLIMVVITISSFISAIFTTMIKISKRKSQQTTQQTATQTAGQSTRGGDDDDKGSTDKGSTNKDGTDDEVDED